MAIERYKQPYESLIYGFDFDNLLVDGETISNIDLVSQTKLVNISGSTDLNITEQLYNLGIVRMRISDGSDQESYSISIRVSTNLSNKLEIDGILHVREE